MTDIPTPGLAHEFDVTVELGAIADHGVTRAGHRRVVPILGGTVTGAIEGTILPGGGDWQLVHDDGSIEIDGRYSIQTASGALVYLQVRGVRNQATDSSPVYFRTTVHVETADPGLARLQHALLIASCVRDADAVRYRAYSVT